MSGADGERRGPRPMKTPHRIIGTRKNGRWVVTARHGSYVVQASAEGTKAGFREATEKARQKLLAKLRAN